MSAGPYAQFARLGLSRKALRFVGLGAAAYLATLVATIPAEVALPASPIVARFGGTMWQGEALLAGGNRIRWSVAPLRSLVSLGLAVDWQATGTGTDLAGRALLQSDFMRIEGATGHADGTFLTDIAPDLPFTCDMRFAVNMPQIVTGGDVPGATGQTLSDAGSCRSTAGGPAAQVGPLAITAMPAPGGSRIMVAPQGQRRLRLAEALIDHGRLDLSITPAGARALPFLAPTGALTMSLDL